MQQATSPTSFRVDLAYALIALAILFAMLASGCVSVSTGGEEPEWKPHVFLPVDDLGPCRFVSKVDGAIVKIPCEPERLKGYYLAPVEDLVTLRSKLQQCEAWR